MHDTITVTGMVAVEPRAITTAEGLAITSFRLVSTQRRFDRESGQWVDAGSNWFTVSAFRGLAGNVAASIAKLDRVIVVGRLKIRSWTAGERSGVVVDIEAESIGHDLTWGTSAFRRTLGRALPASGSADATGGSGVTASEAEPGEEVVPF